MDTPTNYSLEIENLGNYVRASIEGSSFVLDDLTQVLGSIAEYCHKNNADKVLIEDRITFDWGLREMELLAAKMAKIGYCNLRTSIYIDSGYKQSIGHFGETVAQNRGLDLAVHVSRSKAKNWLIQA